MRCVYIDHMPKVLFANENENENKNEAGILMVMLIINMFQKIR